MKSGIIMVRDGYVLLVKGRQRGKWGFPKGHVESGESLETCAHREFREETGMTAVITNYNCMYYENSYYYLLDYTSSCLGHEDSYKYRSDSEEIAEVKWFPISKLASFLTQRNQVNRDLWAYMQKTMKIIPRKQKLRA